jgi:hypothetical protein
VAGAAGVTILRPGLVLGETSYGGSSLARALSALPLAMPVVGDGEQVFNPIHARDLAKVVVACLESPPPPGPQEIGGPERITQAGLLALFRAWMGLAPVPVLRLPLPMARGLGGGGRCAAPRADLADLGGATGPWRGGGRGGADATAGGRAGGVSTFVTARPAGTQDLWHARLYLLRPVLRLVLALLWLASGLIGLFLPSAAFLPLVADSGLPDALWIALARLGGVADLVLAGSSCGTGGRGRDGDAATGPCRGLHARLHGHRAGAVAPAVGRASEEPADPFPDPRLDGAGG